MTIRLVFCLAVLAITTGARADEKLKDVACRSVHLHYPASEGDAFFNEVKVEKSAEGTYFCVCGFNKGYYGIQELANGKKLLIFSVWDPGSQNDPKKVKEDDRVKLTHKDPAVRVGRFGNEGTGGQSFLDYDWKIGETYKFLVKAKAEGPNRTEFAGWFYHPEKKEWMHLVSFSTLTKDRLKGYYSFVEDFRRNKISATKTRVAEFGGGWVHGTDGEWHELTKARFTGDSNPVVNIDAGLVDGRFFLKTGGDIANMGTKLNASMTRSASKGPPELP
jgi:Domain of unknown function (DUF3472)/Domain of unknown function (DUF5077)